MQALQDLGKAFDALVAAATPNDRQRAKELESEYDHFMAELNNILGSAVNAVPESYDSLTKGNLMRSLGL